MARSWTAEQRAQQSARIAAHRASQVLADPNATRLARARVQRNLTQSEVADLAGVHVSSVTAIERRMGVPQKTTRARLSCALAVPKSELFDA
jgi:DNA-binding XRE family transcriptional regulator